MNNQRVIRLKSLLVKQRGKTARSKKQRDQSAQRALEKTAKTVLAARSPNNANAQKPVQLRRILSAVDKDMPLEIGSGLEALAGYQRPTDDFASGNLIESAEINTMLAEELAKSVGTAGFDVAVQEQILGKVSGARFELDAKKIRASTNLRKGVNVDVIGAVHFRPMPCADDPSGFEVEISVRALLYGLHARGAIQMADLVIPRRKAKPTFKTTVTWLDTIDTSTLRDAIDRVMGLDLDGPTAKELKAADIDDTGWSGRDAKRKRRFVIFAANTMLPIKRKLLASGAGIPLLTAVLAQAEHRLAIATKGKPVVVHRDGVPHFWFRAFKALGLSDIEVPLIKLR